MPKRNSTYYATIYAIDVTTGEGKTGDAANISLFVSLDGGAPQPVTNTVVELSPVNAPGSYQVLLTASEMNAESIELTGYSSTPGINIYPKSFTTVMNANLTEVNGELISGPLALESSVQQIVSKLPIGTISDLSLTDQVDGVTLYNIYELVMAMVNGRYEIDTPTPGKITFYKRDNVSILTTVTVSDINRTRDV